MCPRGGGVAAVVLAVVAGVAGCSGETLGSAGPEESASGAAGGGGGGGGAALAAVDLLTVKGRAPKTGYDRDRFGSAWADTDSNKCDTRDDILIRDLVDVKFRSGKCKVASGALDRTPTPART